MAEILVLVAVWMLKSGFEKGVNHVIELNAKWRERRASRAKLAELVELEQELTAAQCSVHDAYQTRYLRYGQRFKVGDDLARHILFALAARQDALLKHLQGMTVENANIQPVIASIKGTKIAATNCLNELAFRTQQPTPPLQLTFQDHASLQMEHQNLCRSAVLYRTGRATHGQLAQVSSSQRNSSCRNCRAVLTPSKMRIPGADRSSCVAIDLSGLFRAHCHAGNAMTCIWQLRRPSCYGVFQGERALLKHLLGVHVRNNGNGADIEVDWPADIRRGDIEKSGFWVRINGSQMQNQNGNLVVPIQRPAAAAPGVPTANAPTASFAVSSPSIASAVEVGYSDSTSEWASVMEMGPPEVGEGYEMPSSGRFADSIREWASAVEMDPLEVGERYEMPSSERFEMHG
ncbi:MAG: hypothetical protein M1839_001705 [Geoglossum umbratile]|nr:MAG: hypothetical protein M1839_001705 [Geoglossum umbratile]